MYKHILVPTDGSQLATQAVDKALELASVLGAEVTFLMVVEPFYTFGIDVEFQEGTRVKYEAQASAAARKILAEATAKAGVLGVASDEILVQSDLPYEAIIETAATRGCDLIAMASHGRRGFAAVLLGSQTMKVLTHTTLPVLVYR